MGWSEHASRRMDSQDDPRTEQLAALAELLRARRSALLRAAQVHPRRMSVRQGQVARVGPAASSFK